MKWVNLFLALALLAATAGCSSEASFDLGSAFPEVGSVPGWAVYEQLALYNEENLYNLVNGQAESFFMYGFERVAVQRYQRDATRLNVEIWQLNSEANAYGLYTSARGGQPAAIGIEGNTDPGRRLSFWQNRYFVSLTSSQEITDEELWSFGSAIAGLLPEGGEIPALVKRLPDTGFVENSVIFFHEEMSIQLEVWLGGENLLGLSPKTDGVLARYQLDGDLVHLIIIGYPSARAAEEALQVLQSGKIEEILASRLKGNSVGFVIGIGNAATAQEFLESAFDGGPN